MINLGVLRECILHLPKKPRHEAVAFVLERVNKIDAANVLD